LSVTIICPGFIQTDVSKNALTGDGSPTNKIGDDIANGYPADLTAKQIVAAVAAKKSEVFVGRLGKEYLAMVLKRLMPGVLENVVRTAVPK
jgi:dehydrogenase/reductase SDR family protein 7B